MDIPHAQPRYPPCPLASEGKVTNQEIPAQGPTVPALVRSNGIPVLRGTSFARTEAMMYWLSVDP